TAALVRSALRAMLPSSRASRRFRGVGASVFSSHESDITQPSQDAGETPALHSKRLHRIFHGAANDIAAQSDRQDHHDHSDDRPQRHSRSHDVQLRDGPAYESKD